MTDASKKITAFAFIAAGFIPLLLPFLFDIKETIIHQQMEKRLKKLATLQTVVLPEKEVVWMDDHEIWVNEKMFDISSRKLENGIYTFTGLYDEEETILVKQEKQTSGKDDQQSIVLSKALQSLLLLYFRSVEEPFYLPPGGNRYPFLIASELSFVFRNILTPPPKTRLTTTT